MEKSNLISNLKELILNVINSSIQTITCNKLQFFVLFYNLNDLDAFAFALIEKPHQKQAGSSNEEIIKLDEGLRYTAK